MILISHRGNINGRIPEKENNPEYIDAAIEAGYEVEIDLWLNDGVLYLGHDSIQYQTSLKWLEDRKYKLWIHCKNIEAFEYIFDNDLHFFWHEGDTLTLTSWNCIWAHSGKQPIEKSIAVLPELNNENIDGCYGVCSDFIERYK